MVGATAENCIEAAMIVIEREHTAAETIIHLLATDEVGFFHLGVANVVGLQAIFGESATGFILLIVTIALGVVETHIQLPIGRETMLANKLEIPLSVVVGLVVIVAYIAIIIDIFATRVVSATKFSHFVFGGIIPSMIGFLLATKSDETHRSAVGEITALEEERIEIDRSAVDIAVGADVGKTRIKCPVVVDETCRKFERLLVSVKHTV